MAITKVGKREIKKSQRNVIAGFYPPRKAVTLRDYIKVYGLKVSEVRKTAKMIGIEPCLRGR